MQEFQPGTTAHTHTTKHYQQKYRVLCEFKQHQIFFISFRSLYL